MTKRERLCLSQVRLDAKAAVEHAGALFQLEVAHEEAIADAMHAIIELQADLERLTRLVRAKVPGTFTLRATGERTTVPP